MKFQWYTNDECKQISPVKRGHITPTIYILNSFEDTQPLNINETPVISKSVNLSCIPTCSKSQNLDKHQKEHTITKTENLYAEMIELKLFAVGSKPQRVNETAGENNHSDKGER